MRTEPADRCRPASLSLYAAVLLILSAGLLALLPFSAGPQPQPVELPVQAPLAGWGE